MSASAGNVPAFDQHVESVLTKKISPEEREKFEVEKVDMGKPKNAMAWQICAGVMWGTGKRTHYGMQLAYDMNEKLGYSINDARVRVAFFLYQVIIYFSLTMRPSLPLSGLLSAI